MPDTPPGKNPRKLALFPLSRLFPNMVTIMGMCFGLSAIRYALLERWEMAVTFILIAIIIDGVDGRLARMLNASSTFGAQLDSLADFLNFGVAPALVIYLWNLHQVKGVGWAVALFFAVCCALRLARFNTMQIESADDDEEEESPAYKKRFFVGAPAPAGAGLAVLPMIATFEIGPGIVDYAPLLNVYITLAAALMASRVPTVSFKHIRISHDMAMPVMLVAGIIIALTIIEPWGTMTALGVLYLCFLPITLHRYNKLAKEAEKVSRSGSSPQG